MQSCPSVLKYRCCWSTAALQRSALLRASPDPVSWLYCCLANEIDSQGYETPNEKPIGPFYPLSAKRRTNHPEASPFRFTRQSCTSSAPGNWRRRRPFCATHRPRDRFNVRLVSGRHAFPSRQTPRRLDRLEVPGSRRQRRRRYGWNAAVFPLEPRASRCVHGRLARRFPHRSAACAAPLGLRVGWRRHHQIKSRPAPGHCHW